jgi:diphthamide synthase (EF-2-diphthine--ammonia ligase)
LKTNTDTLAEGVNLHRSNTVINYDLPWNAMRMTQRVGRVNRVDTTFEKIYTYNFFPTEQVNSLIKLKEAAEAKIEAFIEMLGAEFAGRAFDTRLLHDLPATVDPCGEHGEFHTFVWRAPVFARDVAVERGEVVLREGRFAFCDLLPAVESEIAD